MAAVVEAGTNWQNELWAQQINISAVLLEAGFPYISGYKPRFNYQTLLSEVVVGCLDRNSKLFQIAQADADRPIVVPEVDDILRILTEPPQSFQGTHSSFGASACRHSTDNKLH